MMNPKFSWLYHDYYGPIAHEKYIVNYESAYVYILGAHSVCNERS